jgi:hypothetical protein
MTYPQVLNVHVKEKILSILICDPKMLGFGYPKNLIVENMASCFPHH